MLAHPRPHGRGQDDPAGRWRGDTGWVRVAVTQIGWDGSMRRRALDTCGLTEAGRWETLIGQVLAFPPACRAAPGSPVYVIHAADRAVLAGEQDLTGPLRDLVTTILAAGGPHSGAAGLSAGGARRGRPGPADLPLTRRTRTRSWPGRWVRTGYGLPALRRYLWYPRGFPVLTLAAMMVPG
jgi:hypothetical protein